ncbi:hypothetical protein ASZ90_018715 [hydrocarbon metagenome]|uniref:Flagellar protein n=1 Tax=hydrocarbon metagenome TaxID=938273 RepID=A0A0W8E5P8_9ZZZZ
MTNDLGNCKQCGRLYIIKHGNKLCHECSAEQQKKLFAVRQYLRDHPGQTAAEISAAMDLSLEFILGLIRQGTLVAS